MSEHLEVILWLLLSRPKRPKDQNLTQTTTDWRNRLIKETDRYKKQVDKRNRLIQKQVDRRNRLLQETDW